MTAGLKIRNIDGSTMVDMTMSYSQVIGQVATNRVGGTMAVSVPEGKKLFYVVIPLENAQGTQGKAPGVTLTHTLLTWAYLFDSGFAMNCKIVYGYIS